jgi:glucose dehydrogenase
MATKYDFWDIYIRMQVFLFVQVSLSCPVAEEQVFLGSPFKDLQCTRSIMCISFSTLISSSLSKTADLITRYVSNIVLMTNERDNPAECMESEIRQVS